MVFQEPMTSLNPVYTVGAQIVEAIRLHQTKTRKEARARAIELLTQVGIPSPERNVDSYPHQLSGGMRQRVMIAMALSCNPKVLLADEPTTALDVTIQAQILDLLDSMRQSRGMGVLLITHDLAVVAEHAQRVVVMYAGLVGRTRPDRGRVSRAAPSVHAWPLAQPSRPHEDRAPRAPPDHRRPRARPPPPASGLPLLESLRAGDRRLSDGGPGARRARGRARGALHPRR